MTDGTPSSKEITNGHVNNEDNFEFPKKSFRPARMGWLGYPKDRQNDFMPTADDLNEAAKHVGKIQRVARFGYQIPSYVLTRSRKGNDFTGIIFPGYETSFKSILSSVSALRKKNKIIALGVDFFELFDKLRFTLQGDLPVNNQVKLFHKNLEDTQGTITVLGVPVAEVNHSGYPTYRSSYMGNNSSSLTFIEFDSVKSRIDYQDALLKSSNSLRLQNAANAVLFSPDITKNLIATSDSREMLDVVKDGIPNTRIYNSFDTALNDFAGLGFDYARLMKSDNLRSIVV